MLTYHVGCLICVPLILLPLDLLRAHGQALELGHRIRQFVTDHHFSCYCFKSKEFRWQVDLKTSH